MIVSIYLAVQSTHGIIQFLPEWQFCSQFAPYFGMGCRLLTYQYLKRTEMKDIGTRD